MHQTFYIDIDEEITSVIEKLRKSRVKEIVMVVPKRALLIQSIVNLRLLRKEAENLGLQLMIVTQDKLGKMLIEKAGILVQQKLEDSFNEEEVSLKNNISLEKKGEDLIKNEENMTNKKDIDMKNRLDNLGSESFFDSSSLAQKEGIADSLLKKIVPVPEKEEKLLNKELVTGIGSDIRTVSKGVSLDLEKKEKKVMEPDLQDKKLERFFYHGSSIDNGNNFSPPSQSLGKEKPVEDGAKKGWGGVFLAVIGFIILGALGYAAYLFIPKAQINITMKGEMKAQDYEVRGDTKVTAIDYEREVIPANLISVEEEIMEKFEATGSKTVSNQKAKGTITIYNEFGSSPQPLVATTRFLSEEGKLFRLVKGVTVPGTTKVGEEIKPGVVEAEVMADEAGEAYNIGATKFSIPGFKDSGNDKYTKIYAKSSKPMLGGGSTSSQTKIVSETDVANAKNKIRKTLEEKVLEKIKSQAGDGGVVLDEAINKEDVTYKLSNTSGEIVDNFEVTAKGKISALVFREKDLREVINSIMARSGTGKVKIDGSSLVLEYSKAAVDFASGTINIKVHGAGQLNSEIDMDDFREKIVGKTNQEFEEFLNNYPEIDQAEITYWPPFVAEKIPSFSQRLEIIINNSESK